MTLWTQIFLGTIAVATLTTAIVQVGVLIAAGRMARRLERLVDRIEQDLQPAFAHVNSIARDASRAVALANAQIERVDRILTEFSRRAEDVVATVQRTVATPAREGKAILFALSAALEVMREARRRSRSRQRADDDDVLFI